MVVMGVKRVNMNRLCIAILVYASSLHAMQGIRDGQNLRTNRLSQCTALLPHEFDNSAWHDRYKITIDEHWLRVDRKRYEDCVYVPPLSRMLRGSSSLIGGLYVAIKQGELQDVYDYDCSCKFGEYKIHLMPQGEMHEPGGVLSELYRQLYDPTSTLACYVDGIKVSLTFNDQQLSREKDSKYNMPKIVIYPRIGKRYAQLVLDEIYRLFGEISGMDVIPRFNRRITSLIYYAQGNGDDKLDHSSYVFEEPGRVHYRNDLIILAHYGQEIAKSMWSKLKSIGKVFSINGDKFIWVYDYAADGRKIVKLYCVAYDGPSIMPQMRTRFDLNDPSGLTTHVVPISPMPEEQAILLERRTWYERLSDACNVLLSYAAQ